MPKKSDFRITADNVKSLPTDRDAIYWDCQTKGFGVRVKPGGPKTYVVQYRNAEGVSRRLTLGTHGKLTPKEAETMAKARLGEVEKGSDPAEIGAEARKAMTVKDLCTAYVAAAEKGAILGKRGLSKKVSTLTVDKGRIARHILPLLGKRKVRDLTTPDITRFMRDIAAGKTAADIKTKTRGRAIVEGGAGTAARTVGLLGGILSFAVSEGVIPTNPCRGVKRPADGKREVRLSADQYRALGDALKAAEANGEPWQSVAAFRLIALTGCRLGEVMNLKWADVDLTGHALRLSDSKTGRSVRPLGDPAIKILSSLEQTGRYVFPAARGGEKPYGSLPKAWGRLISHTTGGILEGVTPHGLRHGFASIGGDLGLSEITIAALLGHAAATVTGRYIHTLDSTLVAAADRVAVRIEGYMCGAEQGAEIVPLRRA